MSETFKNGNDNPEESRKRKRNTTTTNSSTSMEELLSVPESILFFMSSHLNNDEQTKQPPLQEFPLLSKSEAMIFIKTSQLAYELDILIQMAMEAFHRFQTCTNIYNSITTTTSNSTQEEDTNDYYGIPNEYSRALLPLLNIHGSQIPNSVLQYVQNEIHRIIHIHLYHCQITLNQQAEQNWNVSQQLQLHNHPNNNNNHSSSSIQLSTWKQIIAEIQEQLSQRIQHIILSMATPPNTTTTTNSSSSSNNDNNDEDGKNKTMKKTISTNQQQIQDYDTIQNYPSMTKFCQTLLQKYGFHQEKEHLPTESTTNQQQQSFVLDTDIPPASQSGREAATTLTSLASSIIE